MTTWEIVASTKRTTERKRDTSTLRRLDAIIESDGGKRRTQAILRANRAYIIELYRDRGLNTPQIGKLLGVSRVSVAGVLRRAGVPTRQQLARDLMEKHRDTIIDFYKRYRCIDRVSRIVGLSYSSTRKVVLAAGFKPHVGNTRATSCRVCGKPNIEGHALCRLHYRVRQAELGRKYWRRDNNTPRERWMVD